jgi:hypothetical protein
MCFCISAAFQDSNPMIIVVCQAWPTENGVLQVHHPKLVIKVRLHVFLG